MCAWKYTVPPSQFQNPHMTASLVHVFPEYLQMSLQGFESYAQR